MHHAASSGVNDVFYTWASTTSIIQVVHCVFSDQVISDYVESIDQFNEQYMKWVYADSSYNFLDTKALPFQAYGHAVDAYTVKSNLRIWKEYSRFSVAYRSVNNEDIPPPPARLFLPTLNAFWNKNKGGIDVYSRLLKNLAARHMKLSPSGLIFLRTMKTIVYNCYATLRLVHACEGVMKTLNGVNVIKFDTFRQIRKSMKQYQSFEIFGFHLADAINKLYKCNAQSRPVENSDKKKKYKIKTTVVGEPKELSAGLQHKATRKQRDSTHAQEEDLSSYGPRAPCAICCSLTTTPHTRRKGFNTYWTCTTCNLDFCLKKRFFVSTTGELVDPHPNEPSNINCWDIHHSLEIRPTLLCPDHKLQNPKDFPSTDESSATASTSQIRSTGRTKKFLQKSWAYHLTLIICHLLL